MLSSNAFHSSRIFSFLVRVLIVIMILLPARAARAEPLSGFVEDKVFVGLQQPTVIQFASDGRVFIAEKSGIIKVYDNLTDDTPTTFADLNVNVYNFWDRGLLGMVLDPNFPTTPYVYVLYAYDAAIGGTAPRWGTPGVLSDPCPGPPGPTSDGCVVSGRLSRLQANGNVMTGTEQVLIEDWCQQYPSHSLGTLAFGADGALYVTGGEGASFTFVDWGQDGNPVNPCGDPPGGVGGSQTPPNAEGGALRAQDLRTSGDPVSLGGMVLRLNPATGAAMPDNPMAGNADPNARRIIATGLRNPFRTTIRPGTNELWIGDVGWLDWEELNRVVNPTDAVVENFGWPCYEGPNRQGAYDNANLNICENLYNSPGAVTDPYYTYNHNNLVVPGESCPVGSSSTAGLAFYPSGPYPDEYDGALFMADYSRNCIWAMLKGANGLPSPNLLRTFYSGARSPVDLKLGPDGSLYYADFGGGTVRRIRYAGNTGGTLPDPWVSQNVGSVAIAGSASFSNNTFTVLGSGADIGGTADGFRYVYQPLSGDGTITARVASIQLKSDVGAKAGVMIRESLTAGSRHASMFVTRGNGLAFLRRLNTDGTSVSTPGAAAIAPYWVRLIRNGNMITGYQSVDGVTWVQVGTDTVNMGTNVFIGLAVSSRNNTVTTTATFDNVTVSTNEPNNQPPTAVINAPTAGTTWKVDDLINFSGSGTDPEDGALPPSAMHWTLTMQHCPSNCHAHLLQTFPGGDSGSFNAPDHEYPSYLELQLTVTDSGGLQDTETLRLDPQTVALTFQSVPSGIQLTVGGSASIAPFTRTVIVGSTNSISAPSSQVVGGTLYQFESWSNGGAQSHNIVAPASQTTYTAQYSAAPETNTPTITPTSTHTNTPAPVTPTHTPTNTPTHTPAPPTPSHTPTNTPGGFSSTGFLAPSVDGAETTKAGDNNGYEVSPGNAYAADGLVAIDANSGTSSDSSCTSQQKDKHRFYNYNFNIPTLAAVNGIEVRLTGSAATTAGTPKICIQLSWNRGDSWTAAQFVPLSTTNATYLLGSPTDTWGRTWALSDLSNTNFRVRVIDVSGSSSNTFSLDAIAVNVTYTTSNIFTNTPTPSNTPLGPTPSPTPTFTNTLTPTPTNTPAPVTPTHTPTITLTHTPAPPTPTHTATNTPGGMSSTGFLAPSANEAEITKAGDNNGYEVSPGNAYAADGLVATDVNSGIGTESTCTSQQKDKHRYYNFNIPALTAVNGIEVKITASAATTAGAPTICIQLSWSRGDSWTAAQSVSLSTVNTTYILGSPTNTWGRTWALSDLSNTNFRVRVIDVSGSTTNTFSLDAIAVNITYQP